MEKISPSGFLLGAFVCGCDGNSSFSSSLSVNTISFADFSFTGGVLGFTGGVAMATEVGGAGSSSLEKSSSIATCGFLASSSLRDACVCVCVCVF